LRFQNSDLLVLQGRAERIGDKLAALGCLPLAERNVLLGRRRNMYLPAMILGIAIALVTTAPSRSRLASSAPQWRCWSFKC
jgi:hypothetical protein